MAILAAVSITCLSLWWCSMVRENRRAAANLARVEAIVKAVQEARRERAK